MNSKYNTCLCRKVAERFKFNILPIYVGPPGAVGNGYLIGKLNNDQAQKIFNTASSAASAAI